jgi:hypothetical protein
MPVAEVEAALGGPPGDYTSGLVVFDGPLVLTDGTGFSPAAGFIVDPAIPVATNTTPGRFVRWVTNAGWAEAVFDDRGQLVAAAFGPCARAPFGPVDSLLWRVQRQWRKWFPG